VSHVGTIYGRVLLVKHKIALNTINLRVVAPFDGIS